MTADGTRRPALAAARAAREAPATAATTLSFDALDRTLRATAQDMALDNDERFELREIGRGVDADRLRYLRNRAFAIARETVLADATRAGESLRWLEQVVKTLDAVSAPKATVARACFSPGDSCLRALRELCRGARQLIDICVFTISDDRLRDEILACHQRGVRVRIISDDDKQHDSGSDIARLRDAGVALRTDRTPNHMHHKFALFDAATLANGSFNWTRSATLYNEENIVVTDEAAVVGSFVAQFAQLWDRYAPA